MKKISTMMIALLAAVTMSANKFAKVTTAPADWSGQYLIAYHTDSVEYVFNCKDENNGYITATATGDTIFSDQLDNYVVEVASMTSGYSVKVVSLGKYMSGTSGSNTLVFGTTPVLNTIAFHKVDSIDLTSNTSMFSYNKSAKRFRYYKPTTAAGSGYGHLTLFKAMTPVVPEEWTPDTISVSEARALITVSSPLMYKSHYIKGVVANDNFGKTWPGWATIWMTDIDTPSDSLEGYKIFKDANSAQWTSAEDIPCGLLDTVMLFADGLGKYNATYETTSGYYVETLGKSSVIDGNKVFKYGVGAKQLGPDSIWYKYELILSKKGVEEFDDNGLHLIINSKKEKGIVGKYTISNFYGDSSYIDGEGPVTGSLKIKYAKTSTYIQYYVKANLTAGGNVYSIDTIYELPGWNSDLEPFTLVNDIPFVPEDGATITCEQANDYALNVLEEGATSSLTVYVVGYANNCGKVSYGQQTFYMDDAKGKTKTVQSYYGNLPAKMVTDSAKVMVKGKLMHFKSGGNDVAEIKNGDVTIIEGGALVQRDVTLEAVPDGALTVAQAKAKADLLGTSDTSEVVVVKGYVNGYYNNYYGEKKTQSFYMADEVDLGVRSHFEAFQCKLETFVLLGDFVYVEGRLTKYVKDYTSYNLVDCTGHFVSFTNELEKVIQSTPQDKVQKIFLNGKLYIVRGGKAYDIQGNVIR